MSDDEVKAELERLRAENAALKSRSQRGITLKVSEKGGVSVYGLGRFPVTLYKEQWRACSTWPTTSGTSSARTNRSSRPRSRRRAPPGVPGSPRDFALVSPSLLADDVRVGCRNGTRGSERAGRATDR